MKNKLYFFCVLVLCGISITAQARLMPLAAAPPITGVTTVCAGATTSLSDPSSGGVWSSTNTAVATVVSGSGMVTGVSAGTAVISYVVSGNTATTIVTVDALPTAITGNMLICGTGTTSLTDAAGTGAWSSSNTNVNVNGVGVVTGVTAGTSVITYATGCGTVTATVLVNSLPPAGTISGASSVLIGGNISLSDATSGAGWVTQAAMPTAMGATAVVALYDNVYVIDGQNSGGCNSGVQVYNATTNTWSTAASLPVCTYQGDGAGVINGKIYAPGGWVGPIPTNHLYIYDPVANSWSTSPALMPSLSADGITGVINNKLYVTTADNGFSGYASSLFSFDPSSSTWSVLANSPIPHGSPASGVINGKLYVAGGQDNSGFPGIQLDVYDPVANTWSTMASMPSAVYGASSGVMNGLLYVAGGLNAANVAQNTVYVYDPVANTWSTIASLPTARGLSPGAVVNGSFYVFGGYDGSSYVTANESYTPSSWSSSNTAVATVDNTGLVSGVTGGTATIAYTVGGACTAIATEVVTVLAPINGPTEVCVNSTIRLSDQTPGGGWTSSNTDVIVNPSGFVTGVSAGIVTITYTTGTNFATYTLTVNPIPAAITGVESLCAFSSVTLSDVDAGTWSSGSTGVATVGSSSGIVTGVTTGTAQISYTNSNGCSVVAVVTISTSPSVIHGASTVCTGTFTTLSNSASGGFWSSSNTSVATIGSGSGQMTGIAPGTATINYSISSGCSASIVVTVNQSPAVITGATNVCVGSTTALSDALTGGAWSIGGTPYASIGSVSGVVSGLFAGNSIVTYTLNSCQAYSPMTVNPLPLNVTGTATVCQGLLTALTDLTSNGGWTSGSTTIATVGSGDGYVIGVAPGTAVISYTLPTGCAKTATVTVNPLPSAILGADSVCAGSTSDLSDLTGGGTWSSSNTLVNTVGAGTGIVTGIASGTTTITYKINTGCLMTADVTVNPVPGPITGNGTVCVGSTITLGDTSASGTWLGAGAATINSAGVVTGISAGTATILYLFLETGCSTERTITVDALPAAISGASFVCTGHTITLSDVTSGGTWSTSSSTTATISATGIVSPGTPGTVTITYQLTSTGCMNTMLLSVNQTPQAITGFAAMCYGFGTNLSDATAGGSWSSSSTAIAIIGSAGDVTSQAAGTSTITYALAGCIATDIVTVHPVPTVINGASSVCVGATISLTEGSTGGTWSSGNTSVASISAAGVVSGVDAGTANITYAFNTGCITFTTITVNPLPAAIAGVNKLCPGTTTLLSDATAGGVWSSAATLIATVGTGLVSGAAAGTARISYMLGTGCYVTTIATVNPLPAAITGIETICVAATATLSDVNGGGVWTSVNTSVATVTGTAATIVVTGESADTATIVYTLNTGCMRTTVVTINPLPGVVLGASGICRGTTTVLSDGTTGGTWSSSNAIVATIGSSSGSVNGVNVGTATFTYTINTGCKITSLFTVYAVPPAILGNAYVCQGAFVVLSDALAGGGWSSSNTSIATIGAGSGIVTGIVAGTSSITYTTAGGCTTAEVITVNVSPDAISGVDFICLGQTTSLSDAVAGGTWSCSTPGVASVGSTGIVSTTTAGVANIAYTLTGGCKAIAMVTINPLPSPIVGVLNVCTGFTSVLSDATSLGTWSSSNTSGATVDATGIVTGISSSVDIITYALSTGCLRTVTFEVYPTPSVITGSTDVCIGGSFTLSDATAAGVWSSHAPGIATVGAATGVVIGQSSGNTTVTYKMSTGCFVTTSVTIDATPSPITGATRLCTGTTITLGEAGTGGAWSSGNLAVASIDVSGVVTGIAPGTAIISYALATGCFTTAVVTVNAYPAGINGNTNVCVAATTSLSDAVSGGTWSSSSPAIASVNIYGLVTGAVAGTTTITYSPATGCFVTTTVLVEPLPATIHGSVPICVGNTIALSDSSTGGTWSSSNISFASVGSLTGVVSGLSAGLPRITYTLVTGCKITTLVTVDALPTAIYGSMKICSGSGETLTDATTGGMWSSSNTSVAQIGGVSGTVLGASVGTTIITYGVALGCNRTATLTVNPSPAAIAGAAEICVGATHTLSDATTGGVWSNSIYGVATVGSGSGIVTGIGAGAATISYTLPAGCRSTTIMTVNAIPSAITGVKYMCAGTTTTLDDAVLTGTWSSSNTLIAGADLTTGIISGFSAGTARISYTLASGCFASTTVTVNPSPAPISGNTTLCIGTTNVLSDAVTGGKWSSSHTYIANIGSVSGVLSGVAAGSATVTYVLPAGCLTTASIAVNPSPAAISGNANLCVGSYTDFSDAVGGGIWTSSNSVIATVGSISGTILGNVSGTAVITYTLASGCFKTASVTVNPVPVAIVGTDVFCAGATATLSDASFGGHWSSSNTAVATIGNSTGLVTSISAGTSIITYKYTTGCMANLVITVNPEPAPIIGAASVCAGTTLFLSDATSGGIWHSSNTSVATVDGAGNVVTISAGKDTVSYSLTTGCYQKTVLTVNPQPAAIVGAFHVCTGSTITISDATSSGTWSSTNTAVATIGSVTGVVSGVVAGSTTISYKLIAGCYVTSVVTVDQTPTAINGIKRVCFTSTTILSDSISGGEWTSGGTTIAPIGLASGVTSGVAVGTAMITYTLPPGCIATTIVTVEPLPSVGAVNGVSHVCLTSTIVLSDSIGGGIWTSSAPDTASVNGLGEVTGVALGNATITYTVTQFCGVLFSTKEIIVNPLPTSGIVSGITAVCIGNTTSLSDLAINGSWSTIDTLTVSVNDSGIVKGITPGTATISYSVTNICGTVRSTIIVTVDPFASNDTIYTHPSPYMCANTQFQNFGVGTPIYAGIRYTWSTINADLVSESPGNLNTLISFPNPGTAYVILNVDVLNTGCHNTDTFTAHVNTTESRFDTVSYYSSQLVCSDNTADNYQWGYDDAVLLDSNLIIGATFQDYYISSPDFTTRCYWVITTHNGCWQKSYYNAPQKGAITSVKQLSADVSIQLYPNPADSRINIEVKNPGSSDDITAQVFDMLGKNVGSSSLVAGKGSIDVSALASGVYSVMLVQNGIRLGAATFVRK